MEGSTDCRACSYMREIAMWDVTNPAPSCQWSQSFCPPVDGWEVTRMFTPGD